ncbi:Rz-like lysis system protein LysB [Plesiomonas shigelloides]|uniref:Rz-like lysis system protein LysB n=1 Tax=Plesiomonas shigelloides TaxID=703 RepID=UPI00126193B5|nr:Rz-like lysis system protein LysB [Plesiomonas shigelloides]KAB7666342.1 LysB family phage lysis regulatory protein [Plesiomonas shigelloides]
MRWIGVIIIALMCFFLWKLDSDKTTIKQQKQTIAKLNNSLKEKNNQLLSINKQLESNDRYQATLQQQIEALTAGVAAKNHRIKELINESAELKRWADTPLPAGIIRLQQRPAITGAAGYHAYLSQHHPLSATSGSADNKR